MENNKEREFEDKLVTLLTTTSKWEKDVLTYKNVDDLLQNWADIIFENNNTIEKLNNCPLTTSEMNQIISQIKELRTPYKLNGFLIGKTILLKRDNEEDQLHFGKEISLKIFDSDEISAGQSRYQIARQVIFDKDKKSIKKRRGDITLLINGMPLVHIELKSSKNSIYLACDQIAQYAKENVFTGILSLVQIFVAMNPDDMVYFANPGPDGKFNSDYYFHWMDFKNKRITNYKDIVQHFLSIPMIHELIGYYTIADGADGSLKVLRSYQYHAVRNILRIVDKYNWENVIHDEREGGYVWHTTGSGKTMTSFKVASLIANSNKADKVIFLMDRIELGLQSVQEYRNFANNTIDVQDTENTAILNKKMKSINPSDSLIVTSIQKMNNLVKSDNETNQIIENLNCKRIVFVVDECHRSTFGDMLSNIKNAFNTAIFFGFTGTPIKQQNHKNFLTTQNLFGKEIHRYDISDGIRDQNVLAFDPVKVTTYNDNELRMMVAKNEVNINDVSELKKGSSQYKKYHSLLNKQKTKMYSQKLNNNLAKGIESYIGKEQYERKEHHQAVVNNIIEEWDVLSNGNKFHAILATSSINEAIEYYHLFKENKTQLRVTALFDASDANYEKVDFKLTNIVDIIKDYNKLYKTNFSYTTLDKFKKDVGARLAHKEPYRQGQFQESDRLDLLIVVNQMLTGFDSKWINTLYLDKVLKYEHVIQAFSRTNRLCDKDIKPFGKIKYYRFPHTMEQNIKEAFALYSNKNESISFTIGLKERLLEANRLFSDTGNIKDIFESYNIYNFEKLTDSDDYNLRFVELFQKLYRILEPARFQYFTWKEPYCDYRTTEGTIERIYLDFDEQTYNALKARYNDVVSKIRNILKDEDKEIDLPFEIDTRISEIETGIIDENWINKLFIELKSEEQNNSAIDKLSKIKQELNKYMSSFDDERQKIGIDIINNYDKYAFEYANVNIIEIIEDQILRKNNEKISKFAKSFGLNEDMLKELMLNANKDNLNEFGKFEELLATKDDQLIIEYYKKRPNPINKEFLAIAEFNKLAREFVLGESDFE